MYESYRDNVIGALPGAKHDLFFVVARRGTEAHQRPASAWEAMLDEFNVVVAMLDESPHDHLLRKALMFAETVEHQRRARAARACAF